MSTGGIVWATAVYREDRPGVVLVIGDGPERLCPATASGEFPGAGALRPTGYSLPPGSRWTETVPGVWQVAVYRHEMP